MNLLQYNQSYSYILLTATSLVFPLPIHPLFTQPICTVQGCVWNQSRLYEYQNNYSVYRSSNKTISTIFSKNMCENFHSSFFLLEAMLKGVCHEIFDLHFFHDSNTSRPLISRLKYLWIRFRFRQDIKSQSSQNLTLWCTCHRGIKILGLANQNIFLQIFSFMIDVFTPKRISPDCPFKNNQRLTKISILTLRCAIWICGEMHTAELDSAVGRTPQSLTPQ